MSSNDPQKNVAPVLGYFTVQHSAALRVVGRLVLLACAVDALCHGIEDAVDFSSLFGSGSPNNAGLLEMTNLSALCVAAFSNPAVVVACVLLLTIGRGRRLLFWSLLVKLVGNVVVIVALIVSCVGLGTIQRWDLAYYESTHEVIQYVSFLIVPLLVLILLTRRDTRQALLEPK